GFGTGGQRTVVAFDPFAEGIQNFALQAGGKILVASLLDQGIGLGPSPALAAGRLERWNADGSTDTTFHPESSPGKGRPFRGALSPQPDGKILTVVALNPAIQAPGPVFPGLARFNPDGSPDPTFGTNGRISSGFPDPASLAYLADGKVLGLM